MSRLITDHDQIAAASQRLRELDVNDTIHSQHIPSSFEKGRSIGDYKHGILTKLNTRKKSIEASIARELVKVVATKVKNPRTPSNRPRNDMTSTNKYTSTTPKLQTDTASNNFGRKVLNLFLQYNRNINRQKHFFISSNPNKLVLILENESSNEQIK